MEGLITDFDIDVHRSKMGIFKNRLRENGQWNYEAQNGSSYEFTLKDGTMLNVYEFGIDKDDKRYDGFKFLLAEINGVPVGFVSIGFFYSNEKNVVTKSFSNVESIIKGKGVGGRLEAVKNYVLQREANSRGTIVDIGMDENKETIMARARDIESEFDADKDRDKYLRRLKELVEKRGYWLSLYGKGGKSGYTNVDRITKDRDKETRERLFFKRFRKGDDLPEIRGKIGINNMDLKKEAEKIRW